MQQPDHSLTRYKLAVSYLCLLLLPGVEYDVPVIESNSLDNRVTRYRLSHRSLCLQFCQVLGIHNLRCTPNPVQQPWQFRYTLQTNSLTSLFAAFLQGVEYHVSLNTVQQPDNYLRHYKLTVSYFFLLLLSGVEYDIPVIEYNSRTILSYVITRS